MAAETSGRTSVRWIWLTLGGLVAAALLANLCLLRVAPRALPAGWRHLAPDWDVMALAIEGDDVWAGGRDGLARLSRATGRERQRLEIPYVRALAIDQAGALWIGHQHGLTLLRAGVRSEILVTDPGVRASAAVPASPTHRVSALLRSDGELLIGTDGGLWRITKDDAPPEAVPLPELLSPMVNVIALDRGGGLWLGSYVAPRGGLTIVDQRGTQRFTVANGLPHNNVNAIVALDEATVVVGTGFYERGGAVLFTRTADGWKPGATLSVEHGLAGPKVRSMFLDHLGVLWVGSEYDGIAYRRAGRWHTLAREDGLTDNEVKCLAEDADGALWLGTLRGLTVLDRAARAALP
jgi:ligand-binding sensor domain-containing protein